MTIFLLTLTLLSTSAVAFFSVRKNIELFEKLEDVSLSLSESLDILEEQIEAMDKKTKIEVFSDEPVVKELIQDMVIAKNSVLKVAKVLDETLENIE